MFNVLLLRAEIEHGLPMFLSSGKNSEAKIYLKKKSPNKKATKNLCSIDKFV
jgi:hypothetical protein